jgi:glutamate-1-semialdehyde 2,1-aminomutase
MQLVAPSGPVYQAGTLSGNPLAMVAGITTLHLLREPGVWDRLETSARNLTEGIGKAAQQAGIPIQQTRVGTMFTTFFCENPVKDWQTAKSSDTRLFGRFFQAMLEAGIYLAPSQFEAGFVSTAHSREIIDRTIAAAYQVMQKVKL